MQFTRTLKLASILAAALIVVAIVWTLTGWNPREKNLAESSEEHKSASETTSQTRFEGNNNAVKVDQLQQAQAGIVTESLPLTPHEDRFKTYGSVVPVRQIADAYQSYETAKSQLAKAKAVASASQKESIRVKDLLDKKLESEQNLQAAQAQSESDQANAEIAASALLSLESALQQQWGDVVSRWLFKGSEKLHQILSLKSVLIQVTLPGDQEFLLNPRVALIQPLRNEKEIISAYFISTTRSVDPRFQGSVLFYIVPNADNDLLGGMNVNVLLPTSIQKQGYRIPRSAVIWYQGKAWIYVKKDSTGFVRTELPTDQPIENGWFVSEGRLGFSPPVGFSPSLVLVKRGAQVLFSEEFRSQTQASGGEEDKGGGKERD